jgi:DNA-binding NarL/FixJ family response regulator
MIRYNLIMTSHGTQRCPLHDDGYSSNQDPQVEGCSCRIMLVDRNRITRIGLREVLHQQKNFEVLGEAGRADEAIELFAQIRPHIVILDTKLPDRDGLELASEFVRMQSRILIFSHQNSQEDLLRAYAAQAHGFVDKSAPLQELLHAVFLLATGQQSFPPQVQNHARERTCQVTLSTRELAVLQLIYDGYSNKQIAHELNVSECTAKTFLARTMKKLGVHDRTRAVIKALDRGWIAQH